METKNTKKTAKGTKKTKANSGNKSKKSNKKVIAEKPKAPKKLTKNELEAELNKVKVQLEEAMKANAKLEKIYTDSKEANLLHKDAIAELNDTNARLALSNQSYKSANTRIKNQVAEFGAEIQALEEKLTTLNPIKFIEQLNKNLVAKFGKVGGNVIFYSGLVAIVSTAAGLGFGIGVLAL